MTDKIIRVKIEAGDSEQQINSLDQSMRKAGATADASTKSISELGTAAASLSPATNAAGKAIEYLGIKLSEADVSLGRFIDGAGRVREATGQFASGVLASGESVRDFAAKVTQASGLNTKLTETAAGVKTAVNSTRDSLDGFGRSAGQAGIQIQQFVGQVQGGVSPLVALSQQATDLGYVLGFPLLGAVVGIAAALGGPLVSAFIDSTDKAEEFKNKLKEIKDVQDDLKGVNLSIEISKLNSEYDKQTAVIADLNREAAEYQEKLKLGGSASDVYATKLDGVNIRIKEAKDRQAELAKQQEELTAASLDNTAKTADQDERIASLNSTLELNRIRLTEGELAARLYAAAQLTGASSVDQLNEKTKQQITELYNLEQAQKAKAAASAELQKQVEEELRLEGEQYKADQEKERRATRERERINERIANMQLETQTYSSQTELMRAAQEGRFTEEEAMLAAQTSARILAATSEYEQLLALKNISDEQKLAAEVAYQEQVKVIGEQYAQARVRLQQTQLNQEIGAYQGFANSAIQLVSAFGSKSFQAQKNAAIATSIVNIAAGVAKALNNPYPANLGFAAQVVAQGAGLLNTIKSTNPNGSGAAPSISGGSTMTSSVMPTTPQAAPLVGNFEIAGLSDLQRQLDKLDSDEVLPVSFTRRLVASLQSVQRLDGQG